MGSRTTSATVERQANLLVPPGLDLSHLADDVTGVTVRALPERHLDAVYYDTADLRLARSGITLRHRTGEPGDEWTVKLPEGTHGPALARREIGFAGPPESVPAAAADLVLATTRGLPLAPVARLSTLRLALEICDDAGRPLAGVVDDTVSVAGAPAGVEQFRELEVELREPACSGSHLLEAVTASLQQAGCLAGAPIPKLVRALGERATRPPDVVVPPLDTGARVPDLLRHALAHSVAQLVRHDPGTRLGDDPEDVHQLRVATRRLRSDLRTFVRLLDRDRSSPIRVELGWLGTQVGAVRDIDVLTLGLTSIAGTLPEVDHPGCALLMARLKDQAGDARVAMMSALVDERYLRLLDALVDLIARPLLVDHGDRGGRAPGEVAAGFVRRPWKRLKDAADALGAEPSDAELHRVRILAKRCRHAAEAVVPLIGPRAEHFAAAVAELQGILGDHQDIVVAEAWLREAAAALPSARLAAGELIALERLRRAELRAGWRAIWHQASARKLRGWF